MPLLRGAESVEERNAERPIPPRVQLLRQALAGGRGQPEAGEVLTVGLRVAHHLVDHGGHGDEDGRSVPRDAAEDGVGGTALVEQHAARARREGEQEVGSHRVAEIELRHRERHVVLAVAEDVTGVALRGIDVGPVRLHRGLGTPRRAAGEEPDGGIVAVGGKVLPAIRRGCESGRPGARPHDQQRRRVGHPGGRGAKRIRALRRDKGDDGATVLEEVFDRVGLELRVDHHYHGADLQDAEQRSNEVGAVGQGDDHALLRRHARRAEHVGIAVGQRLNLAVGEAARVGDQRGPVSPPFTHPGVEEPVGDVELGGKLVRHGVVSGVCHPERSEGAMVTQPRMTR